jgi:hypothetical protein
MRAILTADGETEFEVTRVGEIVVNDRDITVSYKPSHLSDESTYTARLLRVEEEEENSNCTN